MTVMDILHLHSLFRPMMIRVDESQSNKSLIESLKPPPGITPLKASPTTAEFG